MGKVLFTTFGFVFLGLIWIVFAPTQFGGKATYLVISGISMEPRFHDNDLVILYKASNYQVGDIAAYYDGITGGAIIHQIIAQEDDRFILQGINNSWIDPYHPTQTDMLGKFWLHLPSGGKLVTRIQALPLWIKSTLAAGLIILIIAPAIVSQDRQQGKRRRQKPTKERRSVGHFGQNKADIIFFFVSLVIASALLAFFAFSRPLSHTVSNNLTYEQIGEFSYSAAAPPGVYNSNTVQTGEPIFRQLINQITVNFDYQLVTDLPTELNGIYRLDIEIKHDNGWNKTITLIPDTPFNGPILSISNAIDLSQVQNVIDSLEQQTALQNQRYTLAVVPVVSVNGKLAGQPLKDEFLSRLVFNFDETQMQLMDSSTPTLNPTQTGSLPRMSEAANTLSLLGFSLTVSTARQIAIIGLAISLGGLLFFGLFMFRAMQGDEESRIQFKHGSLLIAVQDNNLETTSEQVVDVATIDDLVRLAERNGHMILHYARGATHDYLVKDDGLTYRYQAHRQKIKARSQMVEEA